MRLKTRFQYTRSMDGDTRIKKKNTTQKKETLMHQYTICLNAELTSK
jgi:hypothetical protein